MTEPHSQPSPPLTFWSTSTILYHVSCPVPICDFKYSDTDRDKVNQMADLHVPTHGGWQAVEVIKRTFRRAQGLHKEASWQIDNKRTYEFDKLRDSMRCWVGKKIAISHGKVIAHKDFYLESMDVEFRVDVSSVEGVIINVDVDSKDGPSFWIRVESGTYQVGPGEWQPLKIGTPHQCPVLDAYIISWEDTVQAKGQAT